MKVKNLEITEIKVVHVDSKTGNMKIQVSFAGDTPVFTTLNISESHECMAEKILSFVKSSKKPVDDDDDELLGGISLVTISNDDDVREKIGKGIYRIEQRYDALKRTRSASEYMKIYSQFSTSEDVIYKRGG